ncbi:MAG: Inner membrane ABC transporter permease protein YdcU [Paracidovorax wautersii]|uniref:Inner membrane ABC transporter permease protein YdcU n=1 Tax=Paracidovorax wautersii TaxID=1177982 RepID=A0A7V8FRV5_9BURK|nr:MAG: Inner membrane ABC transporter permease protein YdcU [Paracidovorax wautersii]
MTFIALHDKPVPLALEPAWPLAPTPASTPALPPPDRAWRPLMLLLAGVTLLSLLPSLRLLWEALAGIGLGAASPLARVLADPATWQAAVHTLAVGAGGTVLAVALGAFFALAVTLTDLPRRGLWVFAFMLPLMIPPQVTALAWLQLAGPSSTLLLSLGLAPALGSPQPLYSPGGIVLLLGVQHAPLVFLAMRASLLALPADLCEAARLAGATPVRVLRDVVLPLARPGLVAGAAMAFVSALGNFGIPAMLGIPVGYYTLPTLIYQKLASFGPGMLGQMAALSLLVGVLAAAGVALQARLQARAAYRLIGLPGRPAVLALGRWRGPLQAVLALLLAFVLVAPLMALVASSLVPAMGVPLSAQSATLHAYAEMLGRQGVTWRAAGNSLLLAGGAAGVLMLLALPLAWVMARRPGRWVQAANVSLEIPYALPGTVLAVACILLLARPLPLLQISLYGTLAIIFVAYLARFAVVALKPVQAGLRQLDPALEEAAQLAGASSGSSTSRRRRCWRRPPLQGPCWCF